MTAVPLFAQLSDISQNPGAENAIQKSLTEQMGAGHGDELTPDSAVFLIKRDPFRAIRRGRQLFHRKFTVEEGVGPRMNDGVGNLDGGDDGVGTSAAIGLLDSCAGCHATPRGATGHGYVNFSVPRGRRGIHLFGTGLIEMLADEMTADMRAIRNEAIEEAFETGQSVTRLLDTKGVNFGFITADPTAASTAAASTGSTPTCGSCRCCTRAPTSPCASRPAARSPSTWGSARTPR